MPQVGRLRRWEDVLSAPPYPAGVVIEYPWPESSDRVQARVRGIVESVLRSDELEYLRLEWVTPSAHQFDLLEAGWVTLRLTVSAKDDEGARFEF